MLLNFEKIQFLSWRNIVDVDVRIDTEKQNMIWKLHKI